MISSTHWGVLVAHRHQNEPVVEELTRWGVDHFMPLIEVLTISRGRHLRHRRPLLGEYIPVAINSAWDSLHKIKGAAGVMLDAVSDMPAMILPHELQRLRDSCDGDVYRSADGPIDDKGSFTYDAKVTPREGPFAFQVGHYDGRTKHNDVARFVLFGQERKIRFKPGDLLAV